jgi:hypothetical protein
MFEAPFSKISNTKRDGRVAQMVECLPGKCKTPSSNLIKGYIELLKPQTSSYEFLYNSNLKNTEITIEI